MMLVTPVLGRADTQSILKRFINWKVWRGLWKWLGGLWMRVAATQCHQNWTRLNGTFQMN